MTTAQQLAERYAQQEKQRRLYGALIALVCAFLMVQTFVIAEEMNSGSFAQGMRQFFDYPADIIGESIEAGWGWFELLWKYVPALMETIHMAAVGTIFGAVTALVLAFVSTRGIGVWQPLIPAARRLMDLMRAFPEFILALFLIFMLGASPVPAIIAIWFHTSGALGKLFSEVNENIDHGPLDGLASTGAGWLQRMRFGVFPQVVPNYLSYALLRFEINIRASAILGFVGAGGIGQELRKTISWSHGADTSAIFILLFLTIMSIDQLSGIWRRTLVGSSFAFRT